MHLPEEIVRFGESSEDTFRESIARQADYVPGRPNFPKDTTRFQAVWSYFRYLFCPFILLTTDDLLLMTASNRRISILIGPALCLAPYICTHTNRIFLTFLLNEPECRLLRKSRTLHGFSSCSNHLAHIEIVRSMLDVGFYVYTATHIFFRLFPARCYLPSC